MVEVCKTCTFVIINASNYITGTFPLLPPLEEFVLYLKIWHSRWITNNRQFHRQFEEGLVEYFGVGFIRYSLMVNLTKLY